MLTISVLEIAHLRALISGPVYVKVSIDDHEQSTIINPPSVLKWQNQTFSFDVDGSEDRELIVSLVSSDDQSTIGISIIQLPKDVDLGTVTSWFDFELAAGSSSLSTAPIGQVLLGLSNKTTPTTPRLVSNKNDLSSNVPFMGVVEPKLVESLVSDNRGSTETVFAKKFFSVYRYKPLKTTPTDYQCQDKVYSVPKPLQNQQIYSVPAQQVVKPNNLTSPIYRPMKPHKTVIRLSDLVDEIREELPQLTDAEMIKALKENKYNVDDAIDALTNQLIEDAAQSSEGKKLFSTAIMDIFGTIAMTPTSTIGTPIDGKATEVFPLRRRRALLIGINYVGTREKLRGCVADALRMRRLLTGAYGFIDHPDTMKVLVDDKDERAPERKYDLPTYDNILRGIRWLVDDAQPGDSLVFHFSGHGSQKLSSSPHWETDTLDETILPCDWKYRGHIIDDLLNRELVQHIPYGVKLTAIMDCCHSGTGMDLPFVFVPETRQFKQIAAPLPPRGDVQLLSGCRSDQTSADLNIPNVGAGGAMTLALVTALASRPYDYNYADLLKRIGKVLQNKGFKQIPQLSSSHQFDVNKFSFIDIIPVPEQPYYHQMRSTIRGKPLSRLDPTLPGFIHEFISPSTPTA